jgi:hypothetical protein
MNTMVAETRNFPRRERQVRRFTRLLLPVAVLAVLSLAGCSEEDCVNCVELEPPVVPTGVHSISGDGFVEVRWIEISHHPYEGTYSDSVVEYNVWRRIYQDGDENDLDRIFTDLVGTVAWDENYISAFGLHYFEDWSVRDGVRYEYAVESVNAAGVPSALSFELVTDAVVRMSTDAERLYDAGSSLGEESGWDFSALHDGLVDPNVQGTTADIRVFWDDLRGAMMVETMDPENVAIQDLGVFEYWDERDQEFYLWFEGVSAAPWTGWSAIGVVELVRNHIYVVEIWDPVEQQLNYAKFGVTDVRDQAAARYITMHWSYQEIDGLPELIVQPEPGPEQVVLRF